MTHQHQSQQRHSKSSNISISHSRVSATPPPVSRLLTNNTIAKSGQAKAPRIGPGGRRMVKSFSQDAGSTMATVAATAMSGLDSG